MSNLDLLKEHSDWLQAFHRHQAQANAQIQKMVPPPGQSSTDAQIHAIINQQQQWHDWLLTQYGPTASRFEKQDLHGLSQALQLYLHDLQEANRIFYKMIADRRKAQAEIQAIQKQTNDYMFNLQAETNAQQRASFERQNARWHAAFMGHPVPGRFCSACGSNLGVGFTGWSCPFCGGSVRL